MSISLMTAAWKTDLDTTKKIVFLSLCDNAGDDGTCFPSRGTIAKKCSLSERSVKYALSALESAGYIRREIRSGRSSFFTITDPTRWPDTQGQQVPPKTDIKRGAAGAPQGAVRAPITITKPNNKNKSTNVLLQKDLQIVFSGGRFSEIHEQILSTWLEAYPAVNVDQELARAAAWLMANPKNKKSNYNRFLTNWLSRAQDNARPIGNGFNDMNNQRRSYADEKNEWRKNAIESIMGRRGQTIDITPAGKR